jgi:hypothetical protein
METIMTENLATLFQFDPLHQRRVEADFSGGHLSSDGGALLLRQIDNSLGLSAKLASCFSDDRNQVFVEHSLPELVAQRLYALALGYEDLNDHNSLRVDQLLATAVGKQDPTGMNRTCAEDRGKPLASASTLNRLELGNELGAAHYRKIQPRHEQIEQALLEAGVQTISLNTLEVVIDFDATDDIIHGLQDGRFFHGYYRNYCYLPLYGFIGSVPVWAQLRSSNIDASKGTTEALEKIVPAIRLRCPNARIIVRGDSGFCRDEILSWCEANNVFYCFGLARNNRLEAFLDQAFVWARVKACLCGGWGREFVDFTYRTKESWSCARRVIGKAEVLPGGDNPRFIVTNLPTEGFVADEPERFAAGACYEKFYCARGEMENRIKEQQLDLFADRTSTHYLGSNQLRLWFSTFAYLLLDRLRSQGLKGTQLAQATVGTIRVRLLKVAAQISVSCRRVYVRLASAFPLQDVFATAYRQLLGLSNPHC